MKPLFMLGLLVLAMQTQTAGAQVVGAPALDGKAVFTKNCAACHQATGLGIPGAFPALKANKFVQGDANLVIATVLKGRGGMPTFGGSLDDEKIAAAISYVRTAWGNQVAAVTPEQVQTVRASSGNGEVVKQEKPTNVH
jgi:mono/diheme cytochrome c family protein